MNVEACLFDAGAGEMLPARRLTGSVERVLAATDKGFRTTARPALDLTFGGIPGDCHFGLTRRSGGREPWYPRGTEIANERQLSLVSIEDLAAIARAMELPRLEPEWIGANIVVAGLPRFSMIPPRTRLVFDGGAVLRVDGQNAPCRLSGRGIATNYPDREGLELLFPKVAKRLRGLVGFVEKPGLVRSGGSVTAYIPEQWLYV